MKYKLSCQITVSAYCEVEAENEDEAIEKAKDMQPAMHFLGSGTSAAENWLVEDIDGEPDKISVNA